jgi:acetyl-CoA carboxylase carboxyl transferase subunit beta
MSLKEWFAQKRQQSPHSLDPSGMDRIDDEQMKALWQQCFQCNTQLVKKDLEANASVCPVCGYHFRIGAYDRIGLMSDRFEEWDRLMAPGDPLNFTDTAPYSVRKQQAHSKTGLHDAVITGLAQRGDEVFALGVMDFAYMGGSMGSVVGEKLTRLVERAIEQSVPVVIVTSSGGARMQEGIFSLMQMVKTGAALARLHEAGLLYVTVLTEPTFGGVTASYGTLGDIIIAEEGSRVGFAGRRVIEQTIRQKLPADFQTASYLMKYGQVDMVLSRTEITTQLQQLIRLHRVASGRYPALASSAGMTKPLREQQPAGAVS